MCKLLSKCNFKNFVLFLQGIFLPVCANEDIRFETARGSMISPYISDIIKLSDTFYSGYPYLYDGTQCDEEFYLKLYGRQADGFAVMAFDGDKAVGYTIGGPMKHINVGKEALIEHGHNINNVFVLGEFVLLEPYRGKGIGSQMIEKLSNFAKGLGYQEMCLMQIDEASVDAPKPPNYQSQDSFWLKNGFRPQKHMTFNIDWRNVHEKQEKPHRMYYWTKRL